MKRTISLFLLITFCLSLMLYAQDSTVVLEKIRKMEGEYKDKSSSEKALLYLKISKYCENISYPIAIRYANKSLMYANLGNDKEAILKANIAIGNLYNNTKLFNNAVEYFSNALEFSNRNELTEYLPVIFLGIGNSYNYMGNYQKAIDYYLTGADISEKKGDSSNYISFQISIGTCFAGLNDLKNSLEYFKKGLYLSEKTNNKLQIITASNNIANVFFSFKEYNDAITYYKKAINNFPKEGSNNSLAVIYNNIGECYIITALYDSAISYLEKGLDIRKKMNNLTGVSRSFQSIGNLYYSLKNPEKATTYLLSALSYAQSTQDSVQIAEIYQSLANVYYDNKNYTAAENYFLKSLNIIGNGNSKIQSENYYFLYQINKSYGKFNDALNYYEMYSKISDSIYSTNNLKAIASMKVISDIKKRELEIERLENKEKLGRLKLYLLIALIVIIAVIFILLIGRQRILLKVRKLENIKLTKELDTRKKELIEYAGYIVIKNDMLENIKSDLEVFTNKNPNEESFKALTGYLKNNPIIEKDKQEFQMKAEETNQIFYQRLTQSFPDLTEKERNLAGYLMLGLSSKEIASILNVASTTIDIKRSQLRQKLGLKRNEDITSFLQKI